MVVVQTRRKERVKKVLIRLQRGLLDFDPCRKTGGGLSVIAVDAFDFATHVIMELFVRDGALGARGHRDAVQRHCR
jgi:hypothetical protein